MWLKYTLHISGELMSVVKNTNLKIENFILDSSTEVKNVVVKILFYENKNLLVHISSYLHNTVLVQTLKKELEKKLQNVTIVLLKSDNKQTTQVTLFVLENHQEGQNLSDEILYELSLDNSNKYSSILEYRNQLLKRYFTDHLTDLPNLYQLRKDLEHEEDHSLVLIKIDNFQTINSFYGFVVGDYVIENVAKFLKESLPENKIYRLSGSEYALTIPYKTGFYELKIFLEELYNKIKGVELLYQESSIYINFTLASSSHQENANIFSKVSMALIYAQEQGLPFWIYEDRMNFENIYERNLKLSHVVRDAVENLRIVPYFQAIVDNKTSKVVKYECLARLIDKNEKIISPLIFIPIAKKIKIYNYVTKTMIDKAFEAFEDNDFEFNINLSIEDIMSYEIFEFILEKLKKSKASDRVTFELLESEAIQDFKKVDRFVSEVKRYGAKIAIDDFGSGYSNFFYLTKMRADYIKIDGTLIENIDVDRASLLVVESIVEFAKKLGVKTVAEYVHSSTVMDKVKELGIDYSQGFYIDEPSVKI